MTIRNYELKARVQSTAPYEQKLLAQKPLFKGLDEQVDTYFRANRGRLKLRQGNIEQALIHYERADAEGMKESNILLYKHKPDAALHSILLAQFGLLVEVRKKRKIYFLGQVKFHFDEVENLGFFVEIEVIDQSGEQSLEELKSSCEHYYELLGLQDAELLSHSYSDMLLAKQGHPEPEPPA